MTSLLSIAIAVFLVVIILKISFKLIKALLLIAVIGILIYILANFGFLATILFWLLIDIIYFVWKKLNMALLLDKVEQYY